MAPKTLNTTVRLATHTKSTLLADATHVVVVVLAAAAADDAEKDDGG